MSSSNSRVLRLRCSKDEIIELDRAIAAEFSETLHNLLDEGCDGEIPMAKVDPKIVGMVVDWLNKHSKGKMTEEKLKEWDAEFVEVDQEVLYHLYTTADYLCIKELADQLAQKVANMIRGKTAEEMRKLFNIENDMPEELEKQVREDNSWAFTGV